MELIDRDGVRRLALFPLVLGVIPRIPVDSAGRIPVEDDESLPRRAPGGFADGEVVLPAVVAPADLARLPVAPLLEDILECRDRVRVRRSRAPPGRSRQGGSRSSGYRGSASPRGRPARIRTGRRSGTPTRTADRTPRHAAGSPRALLRPSPAGCPAGDVSEAPRPSSPRPPAGAGRLEPSAPSPTSGTCRTCGRPRRPPRSDRGPRAAGPPR